MGFKELLENIKLVDFQVNVKDFLKGKNLGLVNININTNTYNITLSDTEQLKNFAATPITPELEKRVKEISGQKLDCIDSTFNLLSNDVAATIATATMTTSTLEISLADHVTMSDHVVIKVKE